jgi:hypothetical protein
MNEPRKIAIVFLVIMAIGMAALAIEWLRMRVNGWLALVIVSLILLVMALSIHPIRAHDHNRPGLDAWFKGLTSRAGEPASTMSTGKARTAATACGCTASGSTCRRGR